MVLLSVLKYLKNMSIKQVGDKQLIKLVPQREDIPLMTASLDLSEDLHSRVIPSPLFEVNGIH